MVKEIQRYDFTLKAEGVKLPEFKKYISGWANKFVFQLERGETGYEHYQGRMNLIKPKSMGALINAWHTDYPEIHLSITSSACKDFNYVMKTDTKIDGPWSNADIEKDMTRRLREFMEREPYPWQQLIVDISAEEDDGTIHVIIDECGGAGKSTLCEYMEYHNLGYEMPPFTVAKDLMRACMGLPPQKCYLIDMPRGLKKEKLCGVYAGLECLKNGVTYDKRRTFKKRRMNRPQIIVFTAKAPDVTLLTPRWKLWNIFDKHSMPQLLDPSRNN